MVRRCAWGLCRVDSRYPERMQGVRFNTFPNPKTKPEKCLRWIRACGRPHEQLNVNNINVNKVICSKHFVGENGPTDKYPDPIPADGSKTTPSRPPVKRRRLESSLHEVNSNNKENIQSRSESTDILIPSSHDVVCQTDLLNEDITPVNEVKQLEADRAHLQKQLEEKQKECREEQKKVEQLRRRVDLQQLFTVEDVKVQYGRSDTASLTNENALLLVLCRLRHDMGLKDLAVRFCLSLQSTGIVFNTILDILYFKLGQVSIWPHRDTIISKMTASFRKDFPTSLVIIDGTEFKTQVPHALGLQSQMYSDYKSATTFKALVGCDPSGSVIFISELFTGSISDKAIYEESGFFKLLRDLVAQGYIQHGDAVMADKGFKIQKKEELEEMGLLLNIPPFASCKSQMSVSDTYLTQKIAKHRVHVERVIAKIKTYKILSHTIPASLFKQANKIWTVCAMLTLHQKIFVTDDKMHGTGTAHVL